MRAVTIKRIKREIRRSGLTLGHDPLVCVECGGEVKLRKRAEISRDLISCECGEIWVDVLERCVE